MKIIQFIKSLFKCKHGKYHYYVVMSTKHPKYIFRVCVKCGELRQYKRPSAFMDYCWSISIQLNSNPDNVRSFLPEDAPQNAKID